GLEAHFLCGVRGNDGGDVLFADREGDLREKIAIFDGQHAADQLIAAADFAKAASARFDCTAVELLGKHAVNFTLRDAVMAAGGLSGADFEIDRMLPKQLDR